ncbi:MAG TPA: kelch repeat-containing protein [Chitinophagales bacterium]|nr:kelch repeat-containing protein [Chitinophagales bacterium]
MKQVLVLLLFCCNISSIFSQSGTWTWMKGSDVKNSAGSYGVMGVPASTNEPPGRYAPAFWTDTAGNFWIYGGVGSGSWNSYSDMWKFDPVTKNWTWMQGTQGATHQNNINPNSFFAPYNTPSGVCYGVFTWVTPDNHFWLFGGMYYNVFVEGNRNTYLWEYDPAINQWRSVHGAVGEHGFYGTKGQATASTRPSSRTEGNTAWVDSIGNLWLFGGMTGFDTASNDLWNFDMESKRWTWVSGSHIPNDNGFYGFQNVPFANNYPPARANNMFWKDERGIFWMIGGEKFSDVSFQDVWNYNPGTNEWTYVGGTAGNDPQVPWGDYCVENEQNREGARFENRAVWKVCDNMILNYGGFSTTDVNAPLLSYNDMWLYRPYENKWVKLGEWPTAGNYGTRGVPDELNYPTARFGGVSFLGRDNSVWLFGGMDSTKGKYNDLWKYELDTACLNRFSCSNPCALQPPVVTATDSVICRGENVEICAPAGYTTYVWNIGYGGTCRTVSQTGNYYLVVTDSNNCTAISNRIAVRVQAPSDSFYIYRSGDTLFSYDGIRGGQWYRNGEPIDGAYGDFYVANEHGNYTIGLPAGNTGCPPTSTWVVVSGISDLTGDGVEVFPNPNYTGKWTLKVSSEWIGSKLKIVDVTGRIVTYFTVLNNNTEVYFEGARGLYLLSLQNETKSGTIKLAKL